MLPDSQVTAVSTCGDDLEWAVLRHIDCATYQRIRAKAVPVVPEIDLDPCEAP